MLITALLILVLLLGIRVWWRKTDDASNNAKDDNSSKASDAKDDDSSKASTTSKLDKAKEVAQKAGKKAKEILNAVADIVSSVFWWGVLIGMGYLFISFGYSIYQDAHDFMSSNPTETCTPSAPISTNRIIDGDYVPDKTHGTYLFTMDANKSYRIKVSGCISVEENGLDDNTAPYSVGICSNGKDTFHHKKWKFTKKDSKGAINPNGYAGMAILVVKKDKKIIKKLPIGGNLYIINGIDFPSAKLYLYINLNVYEAVISGEWHVTVDEI